MFDQKTRVTMAVASLLGAAVGVAFGFTASGNARGLSYWMSRDSGEVLAWAIIGAIVGACVAALFILPRRSG